MYEAHRGGGRVCEAHRALRWGPTCTLTRPCSGARAHTRLVWQAPCSRTSMRTTRCVTRYVRARATLHCRAACHAARGRRRALTAMCKLCPCSE